MAELTYERLGVALEATAGTAIAAPTYYLPFPGMLSPRQTVYRPEEARGTRAQYYRSKVTKKWTEWSCPAAGIDVYNLPVMLNMAVAPVTVPTTPGGGTLSRLWTFTRSMTSTTEKTGTFFWGDPNIQSFRTPYGVTDNFVISGDASGDDAVTAEFKGRAQILEKISAPTYPAQLIGPMVTPLEAQLWIDSASAIGTTAITGRVISAEFDSGDLRGDPKYLFSGTAFNKTFARFGAVKNSATMKLRFELLDTTQYDLLMAETVLKVRVRFNGPLIETTLYHYVEIDIIGIFDEPDWSEFAGSNRALDLTIQSQYDATLAYDWSIKVQNDRATL
jgi:hypothetical protein